MTNDIPEDAAQRGRAGGEPRADDPGAPGAPGSDIHTYIGARLREVYDDVASQPIPDRFLELMRQLDAKS